MANLSAEEKKNVKILDRFQCRQCGNWKPSEQYSNKELNEYRYKVANGTRLNGTTAKLRCRLCSSAQVDELECEGMCGEWKPLSEFSKAQRTRGEKWCKECVLWKGATEPGITTAAAPGTENAPDEIPDNTRTEVAASEIESTAFDVVPLHAMGSLSINGENSGPASRSSTANASSDYIPPHLRGMHSAVRPPQSNATTSSATGYVPPHLRTSGDTARASDTASDTSSQTSHATPTPTINVARGPNAPSSVSSISNPFETQSSNSWSAVDARRREAPVSNVQPSRGNGAWAHAAGRRNPLPQFPPARPSNPRQQPQSYSYSSNGKNYYSDGESEDEM